MLKIKYVLILIACLTFYACNINKEPIILNARFCTLIDTKPCSDSICDTNAGFSDYNARFMVFCYKIKNNSNEIIGLPIKSVLWQRTDTANTNIKIYFTNGKDTIYPKCTIGRVINNKRYINPGDSIYIDIDIAEFQEWGNEDIGVNTDTRTLISKLHLEYCKSLDDIHEDIHEDIVTPFMKFDSIPIAFYEVQRGGTLEPLGPMRKVKF